MMMMPLTIASPGHPEHDTLPDDLPWAAPFVAALKQNPIQLNTESLSKGKKLYLQYCASCHGQDGSKVYQAGNRTLQLNTIATKREAGDLAWKISTGRGDMPSWGETLDSEAIWNLVHFLQQGLH